MTPDEAAAIALALSALGAAATDRALPPPAPWTRVHDPRTWADVARREALGLDADI